MLSEHSISRSLGPNVGPVCRLVFLMLLSASASAGVGVASDAVVAAEARERGVDVDTFTFSVDPARIVVGDVASAVVRIEAKDDDGAPLDVAAPAVVVSAGAVSAPERVEPGVWSTRFTPPKDAYPHVAILSATIEHAEETAVGFVPLPLWGKGQTTVSTKPGSEVTVVVGSDSFGPVSTDASGDARVPIVVPPGPEHAVATSVDAVGNRSQKTIDLGVPPFNRLAMVALDDVVAGDGSGAARLLVLAVDKKGSPMIEAPLQLTASAGVLDAPVGIAPGIFEVRWRPGPLMVQEVSFEVGLEAHPVSRASAKVRVIAGAPAKATIVLPQRGLSADDEPRLRVQLSVADSGGNAVSFGAARVDVDYGRLEVESAGDLTRTVVWIVPRERERRQARLFVRGVDGRVLGTAELGLFVGRPSKLELAPLGDVVADGSAGASVVVRAVDAWGNEVIPQGASVSVDGGRVVAANIDATAKRFRALYVPDPRDEEGLVTLAVTVGELEARAPVRLLPRPRALLLVGPAIGSSYSYGDVLALGPELSLLVRLPVLDGAVHAGMTLGLHEGLKDPSGATFNQYRTYPVFAEVGWRPLLTPSIGLHLGVSGGLLVVDSSVAADADGGGREFRAIEPGVAGAVVMGAAFRAGPGFIEVDGRVGAGAVLGDALVDAIPFGAGVVAGYRFGI